MCVCDTAAGVQVEVLRGGRFLTLPSTVLVPGDVIAVVTGVLPADFVLLTGECIVDENMLTGGAAGGAVLLPNHVCPAAAPCTHPLCLAPLTSPLPAP